MNNLVKAIRNIGLRNGLQVYINGALFGDAWKYRMLNVTHIHNDTFKAGFETAMREIANVLDELQKAEEDDEQTTQR